MGPGVGWNLYASVHPTAAPFARSMAQAERRKLIKDVWPDKRLYACVLLFVAGALGVLYSGLLSLVPSRFGGNVPAFFLSYALNWTMAFSLLALLLAVIALKLRSVWYGFAAALCGILSFGFLGIESALSLVAGGFLVKSRMEREDASQDAPDLHVAMWPDKSLAASMLLTVGAFTSAAWSYVVLAELLTVPYALVFGAAAAVVALVDLYAAYQLYHQKQPRLALGAFIATLAVVPFFVVGPLVAMAGLVLLRMAWSEREFDTAASA